VPAHDWTLVEAGVFHAFHTVWIGQIQNALNEGLLPKGFYALAEQHMGNSIADVLTPHASPAPRLSFTPLPPMTGGIAVAEAPPRVRRKHSIESDVLGRRRSLAIRHVSGHRLIALIEIISPANKDREENVAAFCEKAESAMMSGVHFLLVDLFPPGLHDPAGMHAAILHRLEASDAAYDLPAEEPLTVASYAAGSGVETYAEHFAVGANLPEIPLFLTTERYITAPLDSAYQTTYRGVPEFWREVLEGKNPDLIA
jgi:Protein of unknown function (DUF4058)